MITFLALLPCASAAANTDKHDIRWVSSTPLDDLPSGYLAENPGHGFDAWIAPDGVRARAGDGAWQVGLALIAVGRDGAMKEAPPAGVEAHGNRAELNRGSLTEWYVNDERGLEQGFTLEVRPAGSEDSSLVLAMELTGDLAPLPAGNGRSLDLLRPGNPLPVLVYGGLTVVDAKGLELPARLELGDGTESGSRELRIVVVDADAAYPIVVDPLLATAVWNSGETDDTRSVAWGDWDGDGDLDLAAGNAGVNRVYSNNGLGLASSLTAVWTSPESDNTLSVAWGDWDGDGDLDLAAGNLGGANRVYENDGLGQASSLALVWSSADTVSTYSVAWGDWDGDGDLDLAAGNYDSANRVYENDGLGQSTSLTPVWASPDSDNTYSVAWGDWDGDGDLDLAAGNYQEANRVYGNTGGSLTSIWTSADTSQTISVAWGDWDGDGDLDLASGNWGLANRVYENDGLGQASSLTAVWTSADSDTTASIAWGDWDGDGDLDLAAGNHGEANRVYENTGGGLASVWTSADAAETRGVAWGDWDGDGDLDLAAGNVAAGTGGEANRVYENTGGALNSVWASADSDTTVSVAWGDWDGDGDLDLAAGNGGEAARVYENDGLGQASSLASIWTSADTDSTSSVAWGDWDGDGDLDLATGNYNSANRVYENDGLGHPGSLTAVWSSTDTDHTRCVVWGDWDGDGDLDLAAGNDGEANRVYENDGLGNANSLTSVWTSVESENTMTVAWGDWDSDGDLDLAAGNWNLANRVYENDGLGQPDSLALVWSSIDTEYTGSVAWGDWDGDGDLDLAAGSSIGKRVYENDGLGQADSLISAWTSADMDYTTSVAWGDWDGDGDLDLAAGGCNLANRVYENTGGVLTSVWSSGETDDTRSVAWGDWDGDGDLDLAAGSNGENRLYENGWIQRPGGLPETPVSPSLADRPGATDAAFFFSAAECLQSPVTVDYSLTDEESDPAMSIVPEYSVVGHPGWQPATEGPGGSGTTGLPADPDGRDHSFVWDS
ncbi:MAG: VCBS repeat-containing protein, partial [Thermoanaerobaculales bacterium]|nr:VCBS repeat-containing protein [Thermoanaerobaculales bacterium]